MIDLERLLTLRLIVARFGEMDVSRWWNTTNLLGQKGGAAVSRGMPKSHSFARARAVFAVARERCREIYSPKDGITLWDLPPDAESAFEDRWSTWLDDPAPFAESFSTIAAITAESDLLSILSSHGGISNGDIETARKLKRASEHRAVPVGGSKSLDDELVSLLAAGFHRGEPGALAVPYAKFEEGIE